jgi:hypothetical protein
MATTSARDRVTALRALCQTLQADRQPHSVDWHQVLELADELMVAGPLWCCVQDQLDVLPGPVVAVMRERYRAYTIRNVRLRHYLLAALRALNGAGIVALVFKGALTLVDGTHPEIGMRWFTDLDLLVTPEDVPGAEAALRGIGYHADRSQPWITYGRPLLRVGAPGPIDLHSALGSPAIASVLPAGEVWASSTEITVAGASARAPSPTHQVLHNVMHSAVQELNHVVGSLPLRQLIALSSLVRAHGSAVDWATIEQRMVEQKLGRALRDQLWLAHRFAGMELPDPRQAWRVGPRIHEGRVLAGFAMGWPVAVQRNLRLAFGRAYLDSRYAHGNHPWKLARTRALHASRVLRRDGLKVLDELRVRKG